MVAKKIKHDLLNALLGVDAVAPSPRTVRRWMRFLGYEKRVKGKHYYVDGHEREDVVNYRNVFLDKMLGNGGYCQRMVQYEGNLMENEIQPQLQEGQKKCVLIAQDESTVYANDSGRTVWINEDDNRQLDPKAQGDSLMISGFMCSCHGFICHDVVQPDGVTICKQTYRVFCAGKNREDYWLNDHLVDQLLEVLPIFEEYHPNCELLFAFDNSQNHHVTVRIIMLCPRMGLLSIE